MTLKSLIDGAHTASFGKEFYLETTLSVKKWCRVLPLLNFLMSLSECPLVFPFLSTVNKSCSEFPDFPDAIL